MEPLDPHHQEPLDPLTAQQDEVLKLSTGLGSLRSLQNLDADEVQNKLEREYVGTNLQLWRSNLKAQFGLDIDISNPFKSKNGEDGMGHTVRVDSDDKHYHWHLQPAAPNLEPPKPTPVILEPPKPTPTEPSKPGPLSWLLPLIVAGSLGAGAVWLGTWLADKPPPTVDTDTDTDTRSTLRPYVDQPEP